MPRDQELVDLQDWVERIDPALAKRIAPLPLWEAFSLIVAKYDPEGQYLMTDAMAVSIRKLAGKLRK